MQNKKQEQRTRVTDNMVRELKYHHSWRQGHISPEEADDRYQNGELLVAANILTELASNRAKQRDLLLAAQAAIDARNGTWDYNNGSYHEAGYPKFPMSPPANWPLTKADWPVDISQASVVQKAQGLMLAEVERISRAQQQLWRSNFNSLDDEGRELENKRKEISDRRYRRASQRNRLANQPTIAIDNGVLSGQSPAVTYNATASDPIDFTNIQSTFSSQPEYAELDALIEADDDYN